MLVRLSKRRGEYPSGAFVDLPKAEAESLIGFGLAEAIVDVDAQPVKTVIERATAKKDIKTATLEVQDASADLEDK